MKNVAILNELVNKMRSDPCRSKGICLIAIGIEQRWAIRFPRKKRDILIPQLTGIELENEIEATSESLSLIYINVDLFLTPCNENILQ